MKKALLDTNIFSYFLRGETQVVKKFREYQQFHSYLTFSVLTYYEIKSGLLYKDARNLLQQFEILANSSEILPLDIDTANVASIIYYLSRFTSERFINYSPRLTDWSISNSS